MKSFIIAVTIGFLAAGCVAPPVVPVSEELASGEDENLLWRGALKEQKILDNSGLLYQNPELDIYLNRIAKKLQAHTILPEMPFQIKVIKDPHLNAFAFPNGVIYVHTGILARMDNEAQLAALLAHEMTHCTHRHALRVLKSIKDQPGFIAAAQQTLARLAMVHKLARLLGLAGSMAAVTGYSRDLETEADRVGLDLTVKADYDPKEFLRLFEHLRQEIESEGIEEPYFFGTHPNVQQRIENVTNWLATEYQGKNSGTKNTEVFHSMLVQPVLDNARLDLRLGRFCVAQRGVEKYLRTNPDDAQAYYLLGEIFRQRGRQDDANTAITYYQKAMALDPAFAEAHKAMGLIHYREGQKRLAKKFFESCLLLSPDTPDKAYIQRYLKLCMTKGEG